MLRTFTRDNYQMFKLNKENTSQGLQNCPVGKERLYQKSAFSLSQSELLSVLFVSSFGWFWLVLVGFGWIGLVLVVLV